MSTLKVNKIRDTSGSADAITLDPSGGAVLAGVTTISTARITTGITTSIQVGGGVTISESGIEASGIGITCANINGAQIGGRRNIIINGAMNIAQRGTSSSSSGNTQQTVDRFYVDVGGADEQPTQAQVDVASGTTPYTLGFRKSYKITNGNQTGGAGGTDYIAYIMKLEAQDIANSGWNYTDPNSFITLSFWIKSSVAQAFSGSLRSVDGSVYHYKYDTPSLSADTWTKVVKTIPGNANLTFNNDNGHGFTFSLQAFIGTTYTSSNSDTETWLPYSSTRFANNMTSTWYTTNDATLELTGVQLEVGSQATPFEHRSFPEEERLCMRYFEKLRVDSFPMQPAGNNGINSETRIPYHVKKRSAPTVTVDGNLSLTLNGTNSNNTDHSLGGGNTTAATYGIHIFAVISGSSYSHSTMVNSATFLCDCEL